jgi:hypothetical protein
MNLMLTLAICKAILETPKIGMACPKSDTLGRLFPSNASTWIPDGKCGPGESSYTSAFRYNSSPYDDPEIMSLAIMVSRAGSVFPST